MLRQMKPMEREQAERYRSDWALRFAAVASVAALITAVATLVAAMANL
jgi:hypothetical protein